MCGIIGYYGPQNPKEIILNGLKNLEYRGYDSAGVSIWHKNSFKRVRTKGSIHLLEEKLMNLNFEGSLGIGHIRWATHGFPDEMNAHPHKAGNTSLVHNGIIENYFDLKKDLIQKGVSFESETDSELLVQLIHTRLLNPALLPALSKKTFSNLKGFKGKNLLKAILSILPLLKGSYACLVISEENSDEIIGFKKDLPLILGKKKEAVMMVSDREAFWPQTQKVIYLENKELVVIKGSQFEIFSLSKDDPLKIQKKSLVKKKEDKTSKDFLKDFKPSLSLEFKESKEKQTSFMLQEIFEQGQRAKELILSHFHPHSGEIFFPDLALNKDFLKEIQKVFLLACGSSYYAALNAKYLLECFSRLPVEVDMSSEFRYRDPVIPKNSLMTLISQSGETADTLSLLKIQQETKLSFPFKTLGISNTKHSSLARQVNHCLFLRAGRERSVASTKAFLNTLLLLHFLALGLKSNAEEQKKFSPHFFQLPEQIEEVTQKSHAFFEKTAPQCVKQKGFLFLGRGPHYPIALEGALKVKELTYRHAEGYAAGEMKHGPLALVDSSLLVFVLAPLDSYYPKTLNNLIEIKARGGKVFSIGTEGDERLMSLSDEFLPLPKTTDTLYPLLEVIPLQLFAYHMAKVLGHDVDHPRNLAKSVTVE